MAGFRTMPDPAPRSIRPATPARVALRTGLASLLLLGVLLALSHCGARSSTEAAAGISATQTTSASAPAATPHIFFPQLAPSNGARSFPTALLSGTLIEDRSCLRVRASASNTSYLIIWPPEVTLSASGQPIRVIRVGGSAAQIGNQIQLGGGPIASLNVPIMRELRQPLPATCPGPYWLASEILALVP